MADSKKNGIGQLFHIFDENIMNGTTGTASDLEAQTDIYKNGIKGQLPDNEYSDQKTYLDGFGGDPLEVKK